MTSDGYDPAHYHWLEHSFGSDYPYCPWCGADYDSEIHQQCYAELDPPSDDCDCCGRRGQGVWCWACDTDDMDQG